MPPALPCDRATRCAFIALIAGDTITRTSKAGRGLSNQAAAVRTRVGPIPASLMLVNRMPASNAGQKVGGVPTNERMSHKLATATPASQSSPLPDPREATGAVVAWCPVSQQPRPRPAPRR